MWLPQLRRPDESALSVRTMVKTLTRTGNSLALVLDKKVLEATGIDADTKLEYSHRR